MFAVHPRRGEVDMLQQAAVERTEDWVHLVCTYTSSPLHSSRRRTSRSRLSTSGPLGQRPRCVRWRCHDDEDSHQPCTVVMLYTATDQIHHAVFVITHAKHSCHCFGSQPAVPRTMSSLGDRSFAVAGPRAWNKLPPPLRCVHSVTAFKRQLKIFYITTLLTNIVRHPYYVSALTSP